MNADFHIPQNGSALLHEVYQLDKVKYAELVLKQGANINAFDQRNRTLLHDACHGSSACVELHLKMGADAHIPLSARTLLHGAYLLGEIECAEMLLKYETNINAPSIF
ncbi:hypothetical protein CEXT_203081 [Caerostris extrusa]|uniref:Uncharacterized protein n=1 Tax=Caerostris extrusa TaxID=172846 RepID=A0AAV4WDK4_CAEEX|nr:hypothetical protein CEXT_203081 [Caerostris extrusa]